MGSIDFLRCNLKQFLSLQGEWSEISAKAKTIINNSLTNLKEIKFSYQGDELFLTHHVYLTITLLMYLNYIEVLRQLSNTQIVSDLTICFLR